MVASRKAVFGKIIKIVSKRGQSRSKIDQALDVWDRINSASAPVRRSPLELYKGSVPSIDTTESDRKFWEQRKRQDQNNQQHTDQEDKENDRRKDVGTNKEHRPVSRNKWRVKMPSGRVFLNVLSASGALSTKEVDDYIPEYEYNPDHRNKDMPEHVHEAAKKHHEATEKDGKKAETITKAQRDEALKQLDQIEKSNTKGVSPMMKTIPRVTGLNGHEQAAVKVGVQLDKLPKGTDLTRCSIEEMRGIASEQVAAAVAPIRQRHGLPAELPICTAKLKYAGFC